MNTLRVAELFAGVGGFRLGLEAASSRFVTTFSNQWEPPGSDAKQFASRCYVSNFGPDGHFNTDIAVVLAQLEAGKLDIEAFDLVVGGFPCQDFSVAKTLSSSKGIEGRKGVLWWQIHRLLKYLERSKVLPKYLLLENVDRLLKSPAEQRGRDFAIMLASLSDLGYDVEWRVVNAADYGYPQRRRRVFILAKEKRQDVMDGTTRILRDGLLAKSFPVERNDSGEFLASPHFELRGRLSEISDKFGRGVVRSQFLSSGIISGRRVWTMDVEPDYSGAYTHLKHVLLPDSEVEEKYIVDTGSIKRWRYLKGAKSEARVHVKSGTGYNYVEGALPFPDDIHRAARTILTSEGGASPSRSRHIVPFDSESTFRRLMPVELERLNGFPDGWTETGMTAAQRAFCMGNALVVGLVSQIARQVAASENATKIKNRRTSRVGSARR